MGAYGRPEGLRARRRNRVQPQGLQTGVDKTQCVGLSQAGWDSGQGARPSKKAEIIKRRKWQPTPVFLLGESCGQRSLKGCCP